MQRVLPGLGAKIPHASRTKKKKQNQNTDNRSNIITNPIKTLKMAHIKKKERKKENLQESCLARLGHMPTLEQSPVQGKSHC